MRVQTHKVQENGTIEVSGQSGTMQSQGVRVNRKPEQEANRNHESIKFLHRERREGMKPSNLLPSRNRNGDENGHQDEGGNKSEDS